MGMGWELKVGTNLLKPRDREQNMNKMWQRKKLLVSNRTQPTLEPSGDHLGPGRVYKTTLDSVIIAKFPNP